MEGCSKMELVMESRQGERAKIKRVEERVDREEEG